MKNQLKVLFLGMFFSIALNGYNVSYKGSNGYHSWLTHAARHLFIKEDYIRYYPYYREWKEKFTPVDLSKLDLKSLPSPYCDLKFILPFHPFGYYFNSDYIIKLFKHNNIKTVIEIGTFLGLSARHIATLLPEDGKLYAVDPFDVTIENSEHYAQFLSNMIIAGVAHKVIPVKGYSDEVVKFFIESYKKFDFIYVDGDHSFKGVLSDLENYFPLLSETGVMCGDDWLLIEVRAAVLEFAKKYSLTIYADCNFFFLKKEDCGYCYKSFLTAPDSAWKFGSK
jgi:hypothetical protein